MPKRLPEVLLSQKQARLRKQIASTMSRGEGAVEFLENFGNPAVPVAQSSAFALAGAVKHQSQRLRREASHASRKAALNLKRRKMAEAKRKKVLKQLRSIRGPKVGFKNFKF